MILISADTSGKQGSIALARCDSPEACEIVDLIDLVGGTFSAQLVPQLAALLAKHDYRKQQIDAFAVTSGPGSFTGLRVGLAAIKALAEVLNKPIAAVSLLEAVTDAGAAKSGIAALDAGRSEIYLSEYSKGHFGEERLLTLAEFIDAAKGQSVVTPDLKVFEAAHSAGITVQKIERPRSDAIARLGWQKIQAGKITSAEELEANYIRRSDAEIFSHPK